jgi:cell division protein FtsB
VTALPDLARRAARLAAPTPGRQGTAAPAAPSAPRPDLRVVSPALRRGRVAVAAAVLLATGVFGAVSLDALAAESAFEASRLEAEVDALSMQHDELVAEVAQLESPAHVRQVATDQLGMVAADGAVYLGERQPDVGTAGRSRGEPSPERG